MSSTIVDGNSCKVKREPFRPKKKKKSFLIVSNLSLKYKMHEIQNNH